MTEEVLRSQSKIAQALQSLPIQQSLLQQILSLLQSESFQDLTRLPPGTQANGVIPTWNPNGTLATWTVVDVNGNPLFTLTFTWNPNGTLANCVRS